MSFIREVRNDIEREAFRLIREYHAMLVNEARGLGADEQTAEDLAFKTIETYLAKRENELPPAEKLRSWLLGTIRNHYLHSVRGKARACTVYLDQSDVEKLQELGPVDNSTDEAILAHSDAEFVRKVLASLPEETRRVIVLHYFESLSIREIAALLARTPDSVKCNLYYARKVLAKRLGKALGRAALAIAALIFGGSLLYAAAVVTGFAPSPFAADEESEVVFNAKSTENTEGALTGSTGFSAEGTDPAPAVSSLSSQTPAPNPEPRTTNRETNGDSPQQSEAITDNSETKNEENAMSNSMQKVSMIKTLAAAAALTAGAVQAADPGAIEVVASNFSTGEFTLRVPVSAKPLELYYAAAWADDSLDDYAQWRSPVFLRDIPAGTTEVTVTVPEYSVTDTARFFLANPANATVTRPVSVIGGKDGSGNFDSVFVTGLHPNYNWKYDLVFDVPEFGSNQAWLLCNRNNNSTGSILGFVVRASDDKRLRFGHGSTPSTYSTSAIAANVRYRVVIDRNICVVSNLTDNLLFHTLSPSLNTSSYGNYSFWFGASSGSDGKIWNINDKCSFARVYSFKAWNGSGELVGDFRPMVTNSVAGYFDLVTRTFFQSGDGVSANETHTFTPYIASNETQHVDSIVGHLGDLVAVSPVLKFGPVELVSESLGFAFGNIPAYGSKAVLVGNSITLGVPADEFIWWDDASKMSYRVRSAGLRIDAYNPSTGEFVVGTPQKDLRSYTFTRTSLLDGVRVVCLWDAEMSVDPPNGLRAECLRLVDVGTNANGKTEVGHGLFNTGVHPVPATTRVYFDVGLCHDNRSAQNNLSPCGERRFFGVRGAQLDIPDRYGDYFLINRYWEDRYKYLNVGMCNYLDGSAQSNVLIGLGIKETVRLEIDVNPTFTRVYDVTDDTRIRAELDGYERSSEPLNGTLHIFGQHRFVDTTAPLCVDYNNTRYYTFVIWTDGVNMSRDYVPCIDAERRPAFYDRVGKNYIYPIGDKAEIVAEFGGSVGTNSVYVTGENEKGEPAAYLDPGATAPGYYKIAVGDSQTFTATTREVFGKKVTGYRVDTWADGSGWQKGAVQSGRSVTLEGADSIRRVVWIWKRVSGSAIYII